MRALFFRCLAWLLASWLLAVPATAASSDAAPALLLDGRQGEVQAWPAITMLVDASHQRTLAQVQAQQTGFHLPDGPTGNLGPRREVVWLRLPLQVAGGADQWVLDIDYAPMNEVMVYQVSDGRLVQTHRLGSVQPFEQRPMHSRSHAVQLNLPAGVDHVVYLRVSTQSAMVLPITLSTPDAYQRREAGRQLVQGAMLGLALALLVYSLTHWLSLRNLLFGMYAAMLLGTTTFFLDYFGILQQYLIPQRIGMAALISPLSVLVALSAGGLFVTRALDTRAHSPWVHRGLLALALVSVATFLLALTGVLSYRSIQLVATLVGPLVPLLAMPAAYQRARAGDRAAVFMLIGWGTYMVGAFTMAGLLRGLLPATYVTQHMFQWGTLVEMLAWLRVLSLHIEAVRHDAQRTQAEHHLLLALAHTDPLTGLPNRRGMHQALALALAQARPGRVLAVFLLDLDGFKPINDRLGHDAGDELLVQVAQRLKANLRGGDVVARLGGDEFVIVADGLAAEADAQQLGAKLLHAFDQPFDVQRQPCRVGLTVGFALAPHDGTDAGDLLKRADAAMYAGKQAGRHTVRRGGASAGLAGQPAGQV